MKIVPLFALLAAALTVSTLAETPKVFTAQNGQFPWYDCIGVYSIAALPDAFRGSDLLPRQNCGSRALIIPGQPAGNLTPLR